MVKKLNLKIIIPIVVVTIAVMVIAIVISNKKMSKSDMLAVAEELSFEDLNEEMTNNQTRAKEKYIGNVYLITGYVKEFNGNNVVIHDTGNAEVIATLAKQEINMLDKGQKVAIVGKFNDFEYNEETKPLGAGSYTQKTYTLKMKNAYIEKDIFTITGTVEIPDKYYYLYSSITGKRTYETHDISEWYCSVNGCDITEFAEVKKFTTSENEESTILNVSLKDDDIVTIKGKIIKEIHKIGAKELSYKVKDLEISK